MSEIIKESGYRKLSHIVKGNDKYYLVDSNNTLDAGYETMVFLFDYDENDVIDWRDLYCERYKTEKEMEQHHFEVCEDIEKYLAKNKTIEKFGGVDPFWFLQSIYKMEKEMRKNK